MSNTGAYIINFAYELSPLGFLLNLTRLVANRSFSIRDASALAFALFPAIGITSSVTATINSPSVVSICFFSRIVFSAFMISWIAFPFAKRFEQRSCHQVTKLNSPVNSSWYRPIHGPRFFQRGRNQGIFSYKPQGIYVSSLNTIVRQFPLAQWLKSRQAHSQSADRDSKYRK